ncbi:MAG: FctA domain-containing protein [Bilifractor sp.]|nr:FctA domain-containing protein [Bilifractor sp.]
MKNSFKRWLALFLSIAMIAASGITTNTSMRAASDTGVKETTAATATDAEETAGNSDSNTSTTQEVALDNGETTETANTDVTDTAAATPTAAADSTVSSSATDSTTTASTSAAAASSDQTSEESISSVSSSENKKTAEEALKEDLDAATQREYKYEDDRISVTATLTDPKAVPDSAEFVVTPVTSATSGYNYDAYMNALNKDAGADTSDPAYTENNTLLYDMAFYYDALQDDGSTKRVEFEPVDGSVKIAVSFKADQLSNDINATDDADVEVKHLPLTDAVKDSVDMTADATNISADDVRVEEVSAETNLSDGESVKFDTSNFSLIAFSSTGTKYNDWDKVNWEKDFVRLDNGDDNSKEHIYYFQDQLTDEDYEKLEKILDVTSKDKVKEKIKLEYHYITDDSETYVNSPQYLSDRALGIAGNFHIVAFDTATLGAHTNGNVLAGKLYANSNFGTNTKDKVSVDESSYVYDSYKQVNATSGSQKSTPLAVSVTTKMGLGDNGNAFTINGTKLNNPQIVYKDSEQKKYIDANSVKENIEKLSIEIGSYPDANVNEVKNEQNTEYQITDPDRVGVINLNAEQVSELPSEVHFTGFQKGHQGSIIVNVNMDGWNTVTLPERVFIYIDGVKQGTDEVVEFSAGKIIWNFINSNGATITAKNMSGTIIAPDANVKLTQNINGTIIGKNVHNTAETHRSDFTGITKGDSASFGVSKMFAEGSEWPSDTSYSFTFTGDDEVSRKYLPTYPKITLTKDNPTGAFGDIQFPYDDSNVGKSITYHYTVQEDQSNPVSSVVYDQTIYKVKVTVQYNNDGTNKTATITSTKVSTDNGTTWKDFNYKSDKFTFTNQVKRATAAINFGKKMLGRNASDGEFSFKLKPDNESYPMPKDGNGNRQDTINNPTITAGNTATISFGDITYTDAGTYTYTLSEVAGTGKNITYDTNLYKVKVIVNGNKDGTLSTPVIKYSKDNKDLTTYPVFVNAYKTETEITFNGTKNYSDSENIPEFTYSVYDKGNNKKVASGINEGSTIKFDPITYSYDSSESDPDAVLGVHSYTIKEDIPKDANDGVYQGVHYDTSSITINVNVTYDKNTGVLSAALEDNSPQISFTNTYSATGSTTFTAKKVLNGADLKAGAFQFELKDSGGNLLATGTNDANGKVTFTKDGKEYQADYVKNGTTDDTTVDHVYTINEVIPDDADKIDGMEYDSSVYTVTVHVTDNNDGTLSTSQTVKKDGTEVGNATFTNTYTTAGAATIQVNKTLTGHALSENQFTFQLLNADGKAIQTAKNGEDGTVAFDAITYKKADAGKEFHYTVHELDAAAGYENGADIPVVVSVTNKDNVIHADVSYPKGQSIANTYSATGSTTFTAKKTLSGELTNSNLRAGEFTFELSKDGALVATGANDEKGNITFKDADGNPYTAEFVKYSTRDDTVNEDGSQKVFTYTMHEVIPEKSEQIKGMDYDTTVYTFDVSPVDLGNGEIKCNTVISKQSADGSETAKVKAGDVVFNNRMNKSKTAVVIKTAKVLLAGDTNQNLKGGEFFFDLYEGNKLIDKATNDANGNITFRKIEYDKTATHVYTIREENAGKIVNGIRYTDEEKSITISVTKENGILVSNASVGNGFDKPFVNEQLRSITVTKNWEDNNNKAGMRPASVTVSLLNTDGSTYASAVLSADNNWTYRFSNLPYKTFTVKEESTGSAYYDAVNNGIATADVNTSKVTLTNTYTHPKVTVIANKVLSGGTLTSGEFTFRLHRNSDPENVYIDATNNGFGEIVFENIEYDDQGYTVTEVASNDASITYDSEPITYNANGDITSGKTEFINTIRPIVLRVQKRSKEAPHDPLAGATYGLYQVVNGGNDILVESQVSDENGYMYFENIKPNTVYYLKEIAAPEGHEVDPYPGPRFQVKYIGNGEIGLYDENGNPTTIGDITVPEDKQKESDVNSSLLVQQNSQKSALDTRNKVSYSDGKIVAVADDPDGILPDGVTLKVTQLTGKDAKAAGAAVEEAYGEVKSNIAYYDVTFSDKNGKEYEPPTGSVTVTIQYVDSLSLPDGVKAGELKLVHLKNGMDSTSIETVPGTVAVKNGELLETSFTSSSFSTFGIVAAGENSSLGSNYMVTAAGVSDYVAKLNIAKLDTSGKYLKGAKLQIIEKSTGNVMAEWNTSDEPEKFARWFDGEVKTKSIKVDTYYILHEVSAPEGYELADDILFMINKYDSSITVYKYDDNGNLVLDQEAIDKWVSDETLDMIDVPVEYQTKKVRMQKTVKYEKLIQGKDKVVYVRNAKAVKTGDASNIAMYAILLAAAGAVLILLFRARREGKGKVHKN